MPLLPPIPTLTVPRLLRGRHNVILVESNCPAGWSENPDQNFENGALACSVGSEKTEHLARTYLETDPGDCIDIVSANHLDAPLHLYYLWCKRNDFERKDRENCRSLVLNQTDGLMFWFM